MTRKMKNIKINKKTAYNKHYTNKLLLILATFFLFFGVANAGTLSDSSGVLTYDSVNVCMADGSIYQTKINNKYYVEPNNFDDVQFKIDLASAEAVDQYSTREVHVPNGKYTQTNQINLKEGVSLVCDDGVYFFYSNYSIDKMVNMSPKTTITNCNFVNSWSLFDATMIYIEASGISQDRAQTLNNVRLDNVINHNGTGLLIEPPARGGSLAFARFNDLYVRGFENSIYMRAVDSNTSKTTYLNGNWFENTQLHSYKNGFVFEAGNGDTSDQVWGNTISEYQSQAGSESQNLFLFIGDGSVRANTITGWTWDLAYTSGAPTNALSVNATCTKCRDNSFMTTFLQKEYVRDNPSYSNFYYDRNLGFIRNMELDYNNKLSYENISSYITFDKLKDNINDLSLTNVNGVTFDNKYTGTSATFNGSNYLYLQSSDLFGKNTSQTVSLSFKLNEKNTSTTQYILSHPYTGGTYGNRVYLTESGGELWFRWGSQASQRILYDYELNTDTWYKIQLLKNNENNRVIVYVNGEWQSNTSSNWEVDYTPTQTFFGALGASGSYMNGEIDDFVIFDRLLNTFEMDSLNSFNSEFTPLNKVLIDNGGTADFNSNLDIGSNNITLGHIENSLGIRLTGAGIEKGIESSSSMTINAGYDLSGNEYLILSSNAITGMQIAPTGESEFKKDVSLNNNDLDNIQTLTLGKDSSSVQFLIYDNDTDVEPQQHIEQEGTGDASLRFRITGSTSWAMGIDNSDNDDFKISTSGADVGSTPKVTIEKSTGNLILGTSIAQSSVVLYSPDGTAYECSVANGGAFSCS